jgi:hypothetical protein
MFQLSSASDCLSSNPMFPVHYTYAVASKMLQRRGSSFRNGSESEGKLFWTAREEGKLAKLTSKKKPKQNKNKKQKTKRLQTSE